MFKHTLTQIRGVTLLAVRASTRTRVVLFLVLLQVICALALPRVVKGDGTPSGDLEILLTYTLGFTFAIQALCTMWASCSLFAGEISSLRIQMTAVKPVSFFSLWLGKWFSLLLLNAALLVLVYTLVYVQVRIVHNRENWEEGVMPASMHVAGPILPSPEEEALQIFQSMKSAGKLPEGLSDNQILQTLEEKARERYDIINPGDEVLLDFTLVRPVEPGEQILLRIKFDTAYGARKEVKGRCRLSVANRPECVSEVSIDAITHDAVVIPFAADDFIETGTADPGPRSFTLSFLYEGEEDKASGLLLRIRRDVALLIPGGSFEMNLVRSAFVQGSILAVLAAFGITLSACFSFPVAAFASTIMLCLIMISGGVLPMMTREDEKVWTNRVGIAVLRSTRYLTKHVSEGSPLLSVVQGERISRRVLLTSAFWNMGLMPLALAILACAALRRRELANS